MTALLLSMLLTLTPPTPDGGLVAPETKVELRFEGTLRDALRDLADAAGWSLVLSTGPEVLDETRVTVSVKDAPADQVLENLLEPHGLRAERESGVVRVLAVEAQASKSRSRKPGIKDRVVFGGSVDVQEGESVGDAVAIGGSVRVAGNVRDAVAVGGNIHVESTGRVEGDAVAVGGRLVVDPPATVGGDRVEVGPGDVGRDLASKLLGIKDARETYDEWRRPFGWLQGIALFVVFFVLGLVAVALAPRRVLAVGDVLWRRPLITSLWGLVGAIASALLIALLCVTLIGIPLVPLVAVGLVLAVFLGFTALAVKLGSVLPVFSEKSAALSLALGTAVLVVVQYIPVVGCLILWLVSFGCFGAVLSSRFGGRSAANPPQPDPTPSGTPPSVNPMSTDGSDPTQQTSF